ncbi:MAG: YggS family pyridoxal phosphate-dependent enzyme [Candidatus Margulisiibacteriota bacterium]
MTPVYPEGDDKTKVGFVPQIPYNTAMISQNVQALLDEVRAAEQRLGRTITVVGVTKYVSVADTQAVIDAGITHIGENKVQDGMAKKAACLGPNVTWHLLGHLQTNKIKKAVETFDWIESVDSFRVLQGISEAAGKLGKVMNVLLEVNIANEATKTGFSPKELTENCAQFFSLANVMIRGIMTMPFPSSEQSVYFGQAKILFDQLSAQYPTVDTLSMGMSGDYSLAIEAGSTQIRVGSLLFAH